MGNQTSARKRISYANLLRQACAFRRNLASAHPAIALPAKLKSIQTQVQAYTDWLATLQTKGLFAVTPPKRPAAKPKAMAAGVGAPTAVAGSTGSRRRGAGRASKARRAQA
ncbi:MAG TPA: hypothetical protein VFQ79_24560 [Bryobacteraceae bacterium]|nr:hypothetical protein [Bryobacteraceae bacterium]